MRPYKVGYLAGTCAVICLCYLIYKNQTRPLSVEHKPGDTNEIVLEGVFSQDRKNAEHSKNFQPMTIPMVRNNSFDYKAAMMKLNKEKVSQDDPRLIKLIRDYYIEPPSTAPYNLLNPERLEFSNGQTPFVDSRLNYMVSKIKMKLYDICLILY
jgi:hypothetical protein